MLFSFVIGFVRRKVFGGVGFWKDFEGGCGFY